MAIGFVAAASGETTSTGTSTSAVIPAVAAAGHFAIAHMYVAVTSSTINTPAGWTQLGAVSSSQSASSAVFVKFLDSDDPESTLAVTRGTSGKAVLTIAVFSGVDATTPVAAAVVQAYTSTTATSRAANALDSADAAVQLVGTKASPVGTWTPPAGFTEVHERSQSGAGGGGCSVALSSTALTGDDVWTHSVPAPQAHVWTVSLNESDEPPPDPTPGSVVYPWTGGQTHDTAVVGSKLASATSVRLAYSTDPDMADPAYVSAKTPDSSGHVKHTLTGLAPDTLYYVQLADTPVGGSETLIGPVGKVHTHQTPGVPFGTRKMLVGGCVLTASTNPVGLTDAVAWGAHSGIFLGDQYYNGSESTDPAQHVARYDQQFAAVPAMREMARLGGMSRVVRSDHDDGVQDNGDSNNAWTQAAIAAYKQVVPHGTLLDPSTITKSRDQQWDDGRVSFFQTDVRNTDRSPGAMADGPSKTFFGADQMARFLNWLDTTTQPYCVWINDTAFMGPDDTAPVKGDWLPAYPTVRQVIADAIGAAQARGIHVEMWHGDSHLIGYATAAKNTWGNFPVICAAPYDGTGGGRNTSTFSSFYNNAGASAQLYGRVTWTDDGTTITRTFSGWDAAAGVERVSHVQTVTPGNPAESSAFFAFI